MTLPRRLTPAAALDLIESGAHLVSAPGMGAPTTLLAELATCAAGRKWTLSSGLLLGDYPFLSSVTDGQLDYRTWHVMPPVRDAVANGQVGYVPARASQLAGLLRQWAIDAAIVRVSPPDDRGYCSLGPSVSYGLAAVRAARLVIAEVDPAVPRTCGQSEIHTSEIDVLVDTETAIPEYQPGPSNHVSTSIAGRVIELIPRDATIQVGIGAIPETMVRMMADADLGRPRFVGMATDAMVDLFEAGVLRLTDVVPEPAVLSPDMMGTQRLLRFSSDNAAIGMYPSDVSHDPARLGSIDRFVSVNTAVELDLAGNVNSEVVAGRQISGTGGSLDYVDSATRSLGGIRVIALPSASADSSTSRIVESVAAVTIPRTMVDVVATEYGTAHLAGLTLKERAAALSDIAHPSHRERLREAAGL